MSFRTHGLPSSSGVRGPATHRTLRVSAQPCGKRPYCGHLWNTIGTIALLRVVLTALAETIEAA
jgi:hypothetical protein